MFIANDFNWVSVIAGTWTRIAQGPLVQGSPVQWVEFARPAPGLPDAPINATIDGYSASPPYYARSGGPGTAYMQIPGALGGISTGTGLLDESFMIAFPLSPYVEFWVLTDLNCLAHVIGI